MTRENLNKLREDIDADQSALYKILGLAEMIFNQYPKDDNAAVIFNLAAERLGIERRLPENG